MRRHVAQCNSATDTPRRATSAPASILELRRIYATIVEIHRTLACCPGMRIWIAVALLYFAQNALGECMEYFLHIFACQRTCLKKQDVLFLTESAGLQKPH